MMISLYVAGFVLVLGSWSMRPCDVVYFHEPRENNIAYFGMRSAEAADLHHLDL